MSQPTNQPNPYIDLSAKDLQALAKYVGESPDMQRIARQAREELARRYISTPGMWDTK